MPYASVSAILLGRLAVDSRFQRQGVGGWLLKDVVVRVARVVTHEVAAKLLVVDALDGEAFGWYERHGFTGMPDGSKRLYLPTARLIASVREHGD